MVDRPPSKVTLDKSIRLDTIALCVTIALGVVTLTDRAALTAAAQAAQLERIKAIEAQIQLQISQRVVDRSELFPILAEINRKLDDLNKRKM